MSKKRAAAGHAGDWLPTDSTDLGIDGPARRKIVSALTTQHAEARSLAVVTFRCIVTVLMTLTVACVVSMRSPADLLFGGASGGMHESDASPRGLDAVIAPPPRPLRAQASPSAPEKSQLAQRVDVAFIYSPGDYRKGLIVSLRSACLTERQRDSITLHVLALPEDADGALELEKEWRTSMMPCTLKLFVYNNRRFTWGEEVLPKVREHYRNEYNFVQHIDLPGALGRRGVEVALVLDTDIVFHGHDAARIAVSRCLPLLSKEPDGIACSSMTKNGYGMGALVVNTSRYAARDLDMAMYRYALAGGKIQGTKPMMNKFFKQHSEHKLVLLDNIQKNKGTPPCDEGIAHFALGTKPWNAGRGKLPCDPPVSDADCTRWSYCRWQYYLYAKPADLIAAAMKSGIKT